MAASDCRGAAASCGFVSLGGEAALQAADCPRVTSLGCDLLRTPGAPPTCKPGGSHRMACL